MGKVILEYDFQTYTLKISKNDTVINQLKGFHHFDEVTKQFKNIVCGRDTNV